MRAAPLLLLLLAAGGAAAARELHQAPPAKAGMPTLDSAAPCDLTAEITTCKLPDGTPYQRHGAGFANCGDADEPVCGTDQQT